MDGIIENDAVLDSSGSKIFVEFYCLGCDHYLYVWLNINLNGNHVVNCPNCGHKHYRVVENGVITDQRYKEYLKSSYEIVCCKSACVPSAQRRVRGNIAYIREKEAIGLHR